MRNEFVFNSIYSMYIVRITPPSNQNAPFPLPHSPSLRNNDLFFLCGTEHFSNRHFKTMNLLIFQLFLLFGFCVCVLVCALPGSAVPYDDAPAVCRRHLRPVELHELPALALHRHRGAGFNLPPLYQAGPAATLQGKITSWILMFRRASSVCGRYDTCLDTLTIRYV